MKTRFKNQNGITLLELMVTVVIIGIVAAMAIPQFNVAIDRLNFSTAMRGVKSTIKMARSLAVTDKAEYGVHFDPTTKVVAIFKDVANMGSFSFDPGDSVIRVDTLPRQFTLLSTDMDNDVLMFRPNGSAAFGGAANISATGSTDVMVANSTMTILASTGRIDDHIYWY